MGNAAVGVLLVVASPDPSEIGRRWYLAGRQTIGGVADISLADPKLHRRHVLLERRDGRVHCEDLGSMNGTFVGGERIHRCVLEIGDRITIGDTVLRYLDVPPDG